MKRELGRIYKEQKFMQHSVAKPERQRDFYDVVVDAELN
jgi:hypothetical protein